MSPTYTNASPVCSRALYAHHDAQVYAGRVGSRATAVGTLVIARYLQEVQTKGVVPLWVVWGVHGDRGGQPLMRTHTHKYGRFLRNRGTPAICVFHFKTFFDKTDEI